MNVRGPTWYPLQAQSESIWAGIDASQNPISSEIHEPVIWGLFGVRQGLMSDAKNVGT